VHPKGERVRRAPEQTGGRTVPGLGINEERLVDRVGREVMIVFDHNGLVRLCDGLSVGCDFDHFQLWFPVLVDDGGKFKGSF